MIVLQSATALQPQISLDQVSADQALKLGTQFSTIDPWANYQDTPARLTAYFAAHDDAAARYAVLCGDDLAGAVVVRHGWLRGPYVQFLGVLPEFQGRAIGSAILAWFETTARAAGERNLWIAVSDFNPGARRLYERHGFRVLAKIEHLFRDGTSELLLRKTLF